MGMLTPGPRPHQKTDENGFPKDLHFTGHFDGLRATTKGFDQPFTQEIDLVEDCLATWCGSIVSGQMIAFIWQQGEKFELASGPCGGTAFAPEARNISQVLRGACGG